MNLGDALILLDLIALIYSIFEDLNFDVYLLKDFVIFKGKIYWALKNQWRILFLLRRKIYDRIIVTYFFDE